jgi:hypothetical protein
MFPFASYREMHIKTLSRLNARSPKNYISESHGESSQINFSRVVNIQTTTSVHISTCEPYLPTDNLKVRPLATIYWIRPLKQVQNDIPLSPKSPTHRGILDGQRMSVHSGNIAENKKSSSLNLQQSSRSWVNHALL